MSMLMAVNKEKTIIDFCNKKIKCSCVVRNELNKWRRFDQIVYTIPDNIPYMPRVFPSGEWIIKKPVERLDDYKKPYFIPTNAWQMVDEWEIKNGMYVKKTGKQIKDTDYGLHHSTSGTTLGCIKIEIVDDVVFMVEKIMELIKNEIDIKLIVE